MSVSVRDDATDNPPGRRRTDLRKRAVPIRAGAFGLEGAAL